MVNAGSKDVLIARTINMDHLLDLNREKFNIARATPCMALPSHYFSIGVSWRGDGHLNSHRNPVKISDVELGPFKVSSTDKVG
jgi:hypothetical protein